MCGPQNPQAEEEVDNLMEVLEVGHEEPEVLPEPEPAIDEPIVDIDPPSEEEVEEVAQETDLSVDELAEVEGEELAQEIAESGTEEPGEEEEESPPAPANPFRSRRQRRARDFFTYDRLGEPRVQRYTLMCVQEGKELQFRRQQPTEVWPADLC